MRAYAGANGRTIVFASTKKEVNELGLGGQLDAQVLHGDIPQKQREMTLQGFRDGAFEVLVATGLWPRPPPPPLRSFLRFLLVWLFNWLSCRIVDVAARGIDIEEVDLVCQTEPPMSVEDYIHRSGRTGEHQFQRMSVAYSP